MICKAEKGDEFGDLDNRAEARRARPGDKDVRILWRLKRVDGR